MQSSQSTISHIQPSATQDTPILLDPLSLLFPPLQPSQSTVHFDFSAKRGGKNKKGTTTAINKKKRGRNIDDTNTNTGVITIPVPSKAKKGRKANSDSQATLSVTEPSQVTCIPPTAQVSSIPATDEVGQTVSQKFYEACERANAAFSAKKDENTVLKARMKSMQKVGTLIYFKEV